MKYLVICDSQYGFTEQYARWIAEELGCPCVARKDVKPEQLQKYDGLIYGGGLYAGGVSGLKWFAKQLPGLSGKKTAVFTCGVADPADPKNVSHIRAGVAKVLTPEQMGKTALFHLRGGIDYNRLGFVHKSMMAMLKKSLESKKEQIKMVTGAMHKMGYDDNLKVAAVCANENVNPKITETLEASQLKKMNQEGEITGCIVEGPISIDLALRPEIAKAKKYESPVAGDADLLLFPTLVSANCYSKAVEMTGARAVSFVLGAQVPIALTSRATTAENKYCTVVLASAMVGGL